MRIRQTITLAILLTLIPGSLLAADELPEPITYLLDKAAKQASIPGGVKSLIYPSMTEPMDQGELGTLDSFKVVQIVNKTEMLADVHWVQAQKYRVVGPNGKEFYRVEKVTEKGVWIDGYPTDGLADERSYEFKQPAMFEVKGNKSYTTAVGTQRTVLRLVPFDVSKHADLFIKAAIERSKVTPEAAPALPKEPVEEFRTWVDDTGTFHIKAKFVSTKRDFVTLEKEDGSQVKVPIRRLSLADREWLSKRKEH